MIEHLDTTRHAIHVCPHGVSLGAPGVLCGPCLSLAAAHSAAHDPVNHPAHYTAGAVECIDAIEAALGEEGFVAFLRGQVIKYTWRLPRKGAELQDAQKAAWYQARLIEVLDR